MFYPFSGVGIHFCISSLNIINFLGLPKFVLISWCECLFDLEIKYLEYLHFLDHKPVKFRSAELNLSTKQHSDNCLFVLMRQMRLLLPLSNYLLPGCQYNVSHFSCSIPCTQACDLSQWSPWSSCQPETCYSDPNTGVKGTTLL